MLSGTKHSSCGPPSFPMQMNADYEIVIYREEGYWVAEAPELTGCACHGESREAVLREMESLIPEWLELARESGVAIPEPKGRCAFA